jgi:hypothetical protein
MDQELIGLDSWLAHGDGVDLGQVDLSINLEESLYRTNI